MRVSNFAYKSDFIGTNESMAKGWSAEKTLLVLVVAQVVGPFKVYYIPRLYLLFPKENHQVVIFILSKQRSKYI